MAVKKTNKTLIWASVVVVIAGAGFYLLLRKSKKQEGTDKAPTGTTGGADTGGADTGGSVDSTNKAVDTPKKATVLSPIGTSKANLKLDEPLVYGSKGEEVVQLQTMINLYLKTIRKSPIKVDGDFGKSTWNVVKTIEQKAKSLKWWATYFSNLSKGIKQEIDKQTEDEEGISWITSSKTSKPSEDLGDYLPKIPKIPNLFFTGDDKMVYEPTSSFTSEQMDLDI
jgi:hypothetical protein